MSFFRRSRGYHRGSVLPRIAGTRTAEGFRLVIDRTGERDSLKLFYFWAMFAVIVLAVGLRIRRDPREIGLLAKALGAYLLVSASVGEIVRRRRLRRCTVVARPWPIRLGEEVHAELRALVRKGAPVLSLKARLECVEEGKTAAGTRFEEKKRETIYALDLQPPKVRSERRIVNAGWTFTIPDDLPPSFAVASNCVQWQLAATITTGEGEVSVAFDLLVIPEVAG